MLQFFDTLTDDSGNALLGATVAVTNYPSGSAATIYSTNGTAAPIANNTVVADITGQISFYAPDGAYILTYSYKGTQYKVRSPVQILDPISFVQIGDTGSVNAYVLTSQLLPAQLYAGLKVEMKAANTNSGASTLVLNGSAAEPIHQPGGTALAAGMIQQNGLVRFEWDGTQWQLIGSQSQPFYGQTPAEQALSIVPTNTSYQPYTIARYGGDLTGVVDCTSALQTACNAGAKAGFAIVTPGATNALLKIGASWTYDPGQVSIDFQGAYINASSFLVGNWVGWTQANTNANQRALLNSAHSFRNAVIQGPGTGNTTAVLFNIIDLSPVSGSPALSGLTFINVTGWDWGQDVIIGNGAFCETFIACQFGTDSSGGTTYSVSSPSGTTNAGERNTFISCTWFNKLFGISIANGNGEIYLSCCSIDGAQRAINITGGTVTADNIHLEGSGDTDYWINVTGVNSKFFFNKMNVVLDAAKTTFPLMNCDSSCTWGGIFGQYLGLSAGSGYSPGPLVAGTGNVDISTYVGIGTAAGQPTYLAAAIDNVFDPIFASGALTADQWTANTGGSGATAPAVVATHPFSGSNSCQFVGAAAGTSSLVSRNIPCAPGQQVFMELQAQLPTFGAGAQFNGFACYRRADGSSISAVVGGTTTGGSFEFMSISAQTTSYATYSTAVSGGLGRAPPGTAYVQLVVQLGGGAATGYLGRVKITVA